MTTAPEMRESSKDLPTSGEFIKVTHERSTCKNKVYFYILALTDWNRIISPRSLRPLSP